MPKGSDHWPRNICASQCNEELYIPVDSSMALWDFWQNHLQSVLLLSEFRPIISRLSMRWYLMVRTHFVPMLLIGSHVLPRRTANTILRFGLLWVVANASANERRPAVPDALSSTHWKFHPVGDRFVLPDDRSGLQWQPVVAPLLVGHQQHWLLQWAWFPWWFVRKPLGGKRMATKGHPWSTCCCIPSSVEPLESIRWMRSRLTCPAKDCHCLLLFFFCEKKTIGKIIRLRMIGIGK